MDGTLIRLATIGFVIGSFVGVPTAFGLMAAKAPSGPTPAVSGSQIDDTPIVDSQDGTSGSTGAIGRAGDGMFYADVTINDTRLRCLIDTGASGIVIAGREAGRLGLSSTLHYNGRIVTAGGDRQAARSRLSRVSIAGRRFSDVPAIVVRGSGTPCLLGQDMLARLDSMEVHGDRLTLR